MVDVTKHDCHGDKKRGSVYAALELLEEGLGVLDEKSLKLKTDLTRVLRGESPSCEQEAVDVADHVCELQVIIMTQLCLVQKVVDRIISVRDRLEV